MLERIARAIVRAQLSRQYIGKLQNIGAMIEIDRIWPEFVPDAMAVLSEMENPTVAMLDIGNDITSDAGDIWDPSNGINYSGPHCALECWQGMIRTALDEK